jgi:sec-independent protein translocase protein TatB
MDFNGLEIAVLLGLAVIIFGPEKLPELARKAARLLNYVRNIANDAQGKLRDELGPEFANLNLADLNPKSLMASTLFDPVKAEVEDIKGTLADTVADAKAEPDEQPAARLVVAFDTEAT